LDSHDCGYKGLVLASTQGSEKRSPNIAGLDRCFSDSGVPTLTNFTTAAFVQLFFVRYASETVRIVIFKMWYAKKFRNYFISITTFYKILIYIQQDATLNSLFHLETALHVSGGTTTSGK